MVDFNENLIQVQSITVKGKLPDPFTMNDGTPVKTAADWEKRRQEMYKSAVELQYGTMPPKPEFLEVELLDDAARIHNYRITTGRKDHPVSFIMRVLIPEGSGKFPAIVDGDLCWRYAFDKEYLQTVTGNGIAFVLFNRLELVPDRNVDRSQGPLYRCYPEYTFSALGAWAWGYARCVDALEKLGYIDMDNIAFCGHSRGGKTALLAGVLDERATIVNPNESGAGGAGCYRLELAAVDEGGHLCHNEKLADLLRNFPFWFSPEMAPYVGREEELPFDEHFLKALVAPRILLETDAASDIWANPVGSWQTALASKEAFRFLGKEENMILVFRPGFHEHQSRDLQTLVNVMNAKIAGKPLCEDSFRLPFKATEPIFDWRCPEL